MRFHYAGKYNGDPSTLQGHPHEENYVAFKEAKDMNTLALIANGIAIGIAIITFALLIIRGGFGAFSIWGAVLSILVMVPHEFLHGLCFKEDVYMYTNLSKGLLFVIGPETFSKARFVFMSLLPNIVFGLIPFILFFINPSLKILGTLGAISLASGAGDYYNVFNALTQMPKGARTYLNGTRSYWYMPKDSDK